MSDVEETYTSIFRETIVEENWQKVQQQADSHTPVLFPIGVIEEHGPHLPLGSDIYWSYAMCRLVKATLEKQGKRGVIAPPYYWGVNHCTGSFTGSFSLKPETMSQVIFEIFENLEQFSFRDIYCFNYHGDEVHVGALVKAVQKANQELGIHVKLIIESMDLRRYGWNGTEDFLLVVNPEYPMEWFTEGDYEESDLLDIHAGAFETAVLQHLCPELVDLHTAEKLNSSSLCEEELGLWLQGGEVTKSVTPLGYAGNPAGHGAVGVHVAEMLHLQAADIAEKIISK